MLVLFSKVLSRTESSCFSAASIFSGKLLELPTEIHPTLSMNAREEVRYSEPGLVKHNGLENEPVAGEDDESLVSSMVEFKSIRQLHSLLDPQRDVLERSACQTAAGRALWNHVIHDPLAEVLAGETFLKILRDKIKVDKATNVREIAGVMLAVRTLWFDSQLAGTLSRFEAHASCNPQVVMLGAGMDARAYRLDCLKNCTVFEVDFAKVLNLKDALLQAISQAGRSLPRIRAKRLLRVSADISSKDWFQKLVQSGYDPDAPTVWLMEGLIYYLHECNATDALRQIAYKSRGETALLADFMNESTTHLAKELKTNFYFHSDWPEELLPSLGYGEIQVSQIGDADANFGLLQDEQSLFNKIRKVPRHVKADVDGTPYKRLLLVQGRVACNRKAFNVS